MKGIIRLAGVPSRLYTRQRGEPSKRRVVVAVVALQPSLHRKRLREKCQPKTHVPTPDLGHPPRLPTFAEIAGAIFQFGLDLKTKLMVWVSVPVMVTSCDSGPNDSCQAVMVYLPGGKLGSENEPPGPVTAKCELGITAKVPCIQGCTLHFTGMNSACS